MNATNQGNSFPFGVNFEEALEDEAASSQQLGEQHCRRKQCPLQCPLMSFNSNDAITFGRHRKLWPLFFIYVPSVSFMLSSTPRA